MLMNDISAADLDAAMKAVGEGPVTMINQIWFRTEPAYPNGFSGSKPDARSAYFDGYVGAFREIAHQLQVKVERVYAGERLAGLLAGPGDDWDMILAVRYAAFADLRRIVASDAYRETAAPHRVAALKNWRFIATRG